MYRFSTLLNIDAMCRARDLFSRRVHPNSIVPYHAPDPRLKMVSIYTFKNSFRFIETIAFTLFYIQMKIERLVLSGGGPQMFFTGLGALRGLWNAMHTGWRLLRQ